MGACPQPSRSSWRQEAASPPRPGAADRLAAYLRCLATPQLPLVVSGAAGVNGRHLDADHGPRLPRLSVDPFDRLSRLRRLCRRRPSLLFMLFGGVIADRVARRKLLVITQSTMMLLAFILAALTFAQLVQPWHIVLLALALGTANAFDAPAAQAFVLELVDRQDLTNAIALNATLFNLATVVGPTVAGLTYAACRAGMVFHPQWPVVYCDDCGTLRMRLPAHTVTPAYPIGAGAIARGRALYTRAAPAAHLDRRPGGGGPVWHRLCDTPARRGRSRCWAAMPPPMGCSSRRAAPARCLAR